MTAAALRTAIAGLGQYTIGTNAGLCVQAPKETIIAGRHRRIGLGEDELALPAQRRTQVRMIDVETFSVVDHAAPPAAFKMARVTATFASFTLYAL